MQIAASPAVEDTSAAAAGAAPSSPTKDSMVDQMKRNPLINRFFTKKEETAPTTTDATETSAAGMGKDVVIMAKRDKQMNRLRVNACINLTLDLFLRAQT